MISKIVLGTSVCLLCFTSVAPCFPIERDVLNQNYASQLHGSAVVSIATNRTCSQDFLTLEAKAKDEVKGQTVSDTSPAWLVWFLDELDRQKQDKKTYCGYTSYDFQSLLWAATKTMRVKAMKGPILPDTYQASADVQLSRLWGNAYAYGHHGFPRSTLQSECWLRNSFRMISKCLEFDREFYEKLDVLKMPKGW
jgi:hypothetical protein